MPDFSFENNQNPLYIAPPFLPQKIGQLVKKNERVSLRITGEDAWVLPIAPSVSIEGQHHIIRRHVFKQHKGTLKERWTQDDYRIVLTGWLVGKYSYPTEEVQRLHNYFEHDKPIEVTTPRLANLGIQLIAFTQLQLPFTAGDTAQYYVLRGYSDASDYALFE